MRIGVIGAGHIGGTLARHFARAGHDVAVGNSRDPATLRSFVAELGGGARAVTPREAAAFGDVVVVSVPFGRYRELPRDGFAGKIVLETNNYFPRRDGRFEELDAKRKTVSELLEEHLEGARLVRAFNAILWSRLRDGARPRGDPDRIAIRVAGDDEEAKRTVMKLIDEIGFDPVDGGKLPRGAQ